MAEVGEQRLSGLVCGGDQGAEGDQQRLDQRAADHFIADGAMVAGGGEPADGPIGLPGICRPAVRVSRLQFVRTTTIASKERLPA
jgi:hypothetical protein